MGKASKLAKAKKMARNLKQTTQKSSHKVRYKLRYYRKKTRITKSKPTTLKSISSVIKSKNQDSNNIYKILVQPVSSDKNLQKMEKDNTITFIVAQDANKSQIKQAFEKQYNTKVR